MASSFQNSFIQTHFQPSVSKSSVNKPNVCSINRFRQTQFISAAYTSTEQKRPYCFITEMGIPSSSSFYEVLGIPMGASCNEIKSAYRRLARACHPDVVSINQKETSANEFMKIHTAYSTLSDPDKRATYDRDLYRNKRFSNYQGLKSVKVASSSSSMSGFTRRNWETDQCW